MLFPTAYLNHLYGEVYLGQVIRTCSISFLMFAKWICIFVICKFNYADKVDSCFATLLLYIRITHLSGALGYIKLQITPNQKYVHASMTVFKFADLSLVFFTPFNVLEGSNFDINFMFMCFFV